MITQNYFFVFLIFVLNSTCAFHPRRYSSIMQDAKPLPQELSTAHEVILVQSSTIGKLSVEVEELKKQREELLAELRFLRSGKKKRELFINSKQGLLEFAEDKELQAALEAAKREAEAQLEEVTYTRAKTPKERKPKQDSFPSHLPREVVEVAIPESLQERIDSGELFITRYEISETLHQIPAKLVVLQYKKPVLAFVENPERELFTEEPTNLGEKGHYAPSVAAQVVYGKFGLHLPYYRLQDLFSSSGWTPSRSSLDYITDRVFETTQDLSKVMISRMIGSHCLGLDDTNVTLIMPQSPPTAEQIASDPQMQRLYDKMREAKKDKKDSIDAKMWGYTSFDPSAPYDIFDFRVSRHRDGPAEFLSGYRGHVMGDCFSGNMSVILASGSEMTRLACWSHARRHVHEHQNQDTTVSTLPLALMNQLYDIERRGTTLSADALTELRRKESQLALSRLGDWLEGPIAKSVLPASKLGGALQYIRNHWDALNVYVNDGRLPIDNNQCERLMKRVAIGRKNWLFVGSLRAGHRNASLMSLISSAHRQDLDVPMYLESVITHMLRGTAKAEELLPDKWKEHHPEAVRTYREQERRDKADIATMQALRRRAKSEERQAT
jgi:transposase